MKPKAPDRRPLFQSGASYERQGTAPDPDAPPHEQVGRARPPMRLSPAAPPKLAEEIRGRHLRGEGPNPPVVVRMPQTLLDRLDAYRGGKTRPQAIREILDKELPE